jgi:YD repeat-containing protein
VASRERWERNLGRGSHQLQLHGHQYDAADELTGTSDRAANTSSTRTCDPAHEVTSLVAKTGSTVNQNLALTYNADGDRTQQTDSVANTTVTYGYDKANHLTSFAKGTTSYQYKYNGDGLRMSQTTGNSTTTYAWDTADGTPLLLQDGSLKCITGPSGLPLEQVNGNKGAFTLSLAGAGMIGSV